MQQAIFICLLAACACALAQDKNDWPWQQGQDQGIQQFQPSGGGYVPDSPILNQTAAATVIDEILASTREGRALDGFDAVYKDPEVQRAISDGKEIEARQFIKDRLCNLGLMACEEIEGKRHVHPHDVIYAQPVAINPVGRPIPAVPVRGPHIGHGPSYGPPKPVPFPPHRPSRPFPPPIGGPIYGAPRPVPPPVYEPDFERPLSYRPPHPAKTPVLTAVGDGGVQQHVHHHYHHGEKVPSSPGVALPPGPVYEPGLVYGSGGLTHAYPGSVDGGVYGGLSEPGYYGGDQAFYKKKLSLNSPSGNGLTTASTSSYANRYSGYETPRAEGGFNDCYCVPYNQCPSYEVGRKEDGLLIDPRNLDKNIEAITLDDVVVTDGNGTVISRHFKREGAEAEAAKETGAQAKAAEEQKSERKRRDTAAERQSAETNSHVKPTKGDDGGKEDQVTGETKSSLTTAVDQQERQAGYGGNRCGPRYVCCRRPSRPQNLNRPHQCGRRNAQGINGRIKTPVYVDGDSEFGEYPWQVAILKKDSHESVYVCGGTLIDSLHIITAAHCVKSYSHHDLRVRLGEWDVNHDVEFYPYEEHDVTLMVVHPEFYAGTLQNDLAVLRIDRPVDFQRSPHISPACLPDPGADYSGQRCWTTGWGKDAFGDYGKYQNILKEVDVPMVSQHQCQSQLQQTRLGYEFRLHPGMICAGGEEGKDACKGDGGGPLVCERGGGSWQVVGVVSWGIGCGQRGVPGVYVRVAHYLDWLRQVTNRF